MLNFPPRWIVACLVLAVPVGVVPALAATPAEPAPRAAVDLRLAMEPRDAEVLFRKEPFDESSFAVRVLDGPRELSGRAKVAGSFSRRFLKKSLQIKLDGEARWRDNSRLSLKAMATDPSYLREWAAWDLAHALGSVTPRTERVRLFINGEFIGPFMFFDWIDAGMMARRGLGPDGALYHPKDETFCGGLHDAAADELRRCWSQFAPRQGDFSELQALARDLAGVRAEDFERFLDERFDADSVINWIVLNTITSNTDTYNKNYFLYLSRKTGKWVVIPWDYDLSFGRNADPALPFPKSVFNDNYQYFYTPELGNPNPLKDKLLGNAGLYRRLQARLAHVMGVERDAAAPAAAFGWFDPDRFGPRLRAWARDLAPDVADDRYRPGASQDFGLHVDALHDYNLARFHLLRHQVLGVTVFGTARWLPGTAYPLLTPPPAGGAPVRQHTPLVLSANATLEVGGRRIVAVDEQYSRPLGVFREFELSAPAQVRVEVETEREPAVLPQGKRPGQCIRRSWFVDLKSPAPAIQTGLTLDYLHESSLHHELGALVVDQAALTLWALAEGVWSRLPTRANPVSKTLSVERVALQPGRVVRMVACVD